MTDTFDYIVVGAGSGGCAAARRLADNSSARVLLVEAGGSDRKLSVKAPVAFAQQFHTKLDWDYWTEPERHLNGRRIFSPRGKMLGGSSSMNAMIYIRGNRQDFDEWEAGGAHGWGYADVLPTFVRAERNHDLTDRFHGQDGLLDVSSIPDVDPVSTALVDAAVATGLTRNADFNGECQEGVGQFQVTQKRGRRWSAADAYLRSSPPPNLFVRTGVHVTQVNVTAGRATGVQVSDGKGSSERIDATSSVVLAAGAFGTPALLQLSGIGPADHLRSVGISPITDLPVGDHLMEHPLVYTTHELSGPRQGLFDAEQPLHLANWLLRRRGKLASNVAECGGHVRTDPALSAPNFQMLFAPAFFYDHGLMSWDRPAATIAMSYIAPRSTGTVRIRTDNPLRKPAVTYNMISEQGEMEEMIDAVELARDVSRAARARGVLGQEITPGPTVKSRPEIADWVRSSAQHTYHPSCTARIGDEGVVDPQLRVHGVEGLRIADASAMPKVVRGNTNAAAIMIGERCADFLSQS